MSKAGAFLVLALLLFSITTYTQTPLIDSLRAKFYTARTDEDKLAALLHLCEEHHSLNRDSFDVYGPVIRDLSDRSRNPQYKSLAALAYANWYFRWGWSDSSLVFIEPEFTKNSAGDPATRDIYFKLSRAKAMYLGSKSRFAEALDVLYRILPEAERYKDTLTIGLTCNTIGSVALARQLPAESLDWIKRAIAIGVNNIQVLAPAYINAGNAYASLGKTDSAEYFISKGLPLCRQLQNLNYTATALRIQTNIYTGLGRFKEAEKALLEMINIRAKLSPANFLIDDNVQLADFYANSGQINKAIEVCLSNLKRGSITSGSSGGSTVVSNDPKLRVFYIQKLAGYYKEAGRMKDYQESLEELVEAKDSLYAANSVEAIAELQTKYEVQKKENTILQQKYDIQRKNFLFYGSVILTLILTITGIAWFSNYRRKQKDRVKRMMEEERKQAEERERVRIASDLHDNLGAYAASMASNLSYIHLPGMDTATQNAFQELTNNSNAIISQLNDTIWVLKKDELNLTAISDRIKTFINRLRKSYPGINIDVLENIRVDHKIPSFQAFHLYRILQEAINNALKHSNGKLVLVNIEAGKEWEVSVTDDGRGFEPGGAGHENGNGLFNMQERARECGWSISWERLSPSGMIVKVISTTN